MSPVSNMALSLLCVMTAAVVRGLTGFGFAAIAVIGLSLLGSLPEAVPLVLCLEVLSSLMLLRGTWRVASHVHLQRLLLAGACGVPLGVWLLTGLDSASLSIGVYVLIGALAIVGLARLEIPMGNNRVGGWLVGSCCGALISAFSMGGPLVVAWLSHCGLRADSLRATLILFFWVIDLVALGSLAAVDAIPVGTARHALYLLPALLLGLWLGQRLFLRLSAERAVRLTQWLLLLLAGVGLSKRAWS